MIVGATDETRSWVLPKNLIIHHSPFFAAALKGSFLESSSNSIKLIEDDPAIFELFVQWLYLGRINEEEIRDRGILAYLKAWILGDKLGCLKFKDCVMIHIIDYHEGSYIRTSSVRYAYNNAPSPSKLRQWALTQFWHESINSELEESGECLKIWETLVSETEGLAHELTLLFIRGYKPANPFWNKQEYLSEPTSQS